MKIAILDKRVRHNIALFKHLILRQQEKTQREIETSNKAFRVYINRMTGAWVFEELNKKLQKDEQWQAAVIQLSPSGDKLSFEISPEDQTNSFDYSSFDPHALILLSKTINILNQLTFDPKEQKSRFWALRHVSLLDFEMTEEEEGRRRLIEEAWYYTDRTGAEYLLSRTKIGTYLFRKDEFAVTLEEALNDESLYPITCITLTYAAPDEKISEKTLVYKNEEWTIYDDDPTLSGPSFPTMRDLLESLPEVLYPRERS